MANQGNQLEGIDHIVVLMMETRSFYNVMGCLFQGNTPMDTDPGIIMNCFTPESLPVINGLAKAYAVCDRWFSSVPTQTFPNRSFIHAATSSGYVTNFWSTGLHEWDIGY